MAVDPRSLLDPALSLDAKFDVDEVASRAKLDQNEAAADLPAGLRELLVATLADEAWNRYPQPAAYAAVKERFARAIGQPARRVVLTVGCDQVILACFLAMGGPGRRARIFEPTYPIYAHFAQLTRTGLERVALRAEGLTAELLVGSRPDHLLVLVSPNNPTGQVVERAVIQRALGIEPARAVLVDEAYVDFAGAGASSVDLLDAYPNLIVGRSLSKSLLAGVRLGYAIARAPLIAALERLLFAPYHLNHLQLAVAACFERLRGHLADRVADVIAERGELEAGLTGMGLEVWPSVANFILFRPGPTQPPAAVIYRRLLERGVRVRDASGFVGLQGHLRVTVGLPRENERFLAELRAAL